MRQGKKNQVAFIHPLNASSFKEAPRVRQKLWVNIRDQSVSVCPRRYVINFKMGVLIQEPQ
jgi:hypothetical protein